MLSRSVMVDGYHSLQVVAPSESGHRRVNLIQRWPLGLYAIVDVDKVNGAGLPVLGVAEAVLAARPVFLQLRAKSASAGEVLKWLRGLQPMCRAAGVPLFANDRPDLAVLAACDGVHVGQSDLPVVEVRHFAPQLRVGVSTHSLAQLRAALDVRPDYVAYGPVFPTTSKDQPEPTVGMQGLGRAAALCAKAGIPLVAIGGIDITRASELADAGVIGAAIGALVSGATNLADVRARAQSLHGQLARRMS